MIEDVYGEFIIQISLNPCVTKEFYAKELLSCKDICIEYSFSNMRIENIIVKFIQNMNLIIFFKNSFIYDFINEYFIYPEKILKNLKTMYI